MSIDCNIFRHKPTRGDDKKSVNIATEPIMAYPMTSTEASTQTIPTRVYAVLVFGLIAIGMSAILARAAQGEGIPSLLIASGRLLLATVIIAPIVWRRYRHEYRKLTQADFVKIVVAGFFLAVHFASWIVSLEYISVLISVVLLSTTPVWTAILEVIFLRLRLPWIVGVAMIVVLVGGIIIGIPTDSEPPSESSNALLGGGLALVGAITVGVYLIIGRNIRAKLSLVPYIGLVYGSAAISLLPVLFLTQTPITGHSATGYLMIVLAALLPQLIGHSSLNFAMGYIPATYVSLTALLEPIASAFLAFIFFQETPTALQFIGSTVMLLGIGLAAIGQSRKIANSEHAPNA